MESRGHLEAALGQARQRRRLPHPEVRRVLREQAGLTQAAVAAVVGVTPPEVSRWERGRRAPRSGVTLERYLQVLDRCAAEAARVGQ